MTSNEKVINHKFVPRSTTFILVITPSDFVWTIQILNFKKWQLQTRFWNSKWFQLKKLSPIKLYNSSRSTTFILIISSSDKAVVYIVHKSINLSHSLYKLCEKVIDLDEFNNFYVHNFFSWNHLRFQNVVWSCHFWKFKF